MSFGIPTRSSQIGSTHYWYTPLSPSWSCLNSPHFPLSTYHSIITSNIFDRSSRMDERHSFSSSLNYSSIASCFSRKFLRTCMSCSISFCTSIIMITMQIIIYYLIVILIDKIICDYLIVIQIDKIKIVSHFCLLGLTGIYKDLAFRALLFTSLIEENRCYFFNFYGRIASLFINSLRLLLWEKY